MRLPIDPASVKGFLDPEEGRLLNEVARAQGGRGACVEIGAYCGRSSLYIGAALKETGGVLFSIDHHYGSEENQPGWDYHDRELWSEEAGSIDTLSAFRHTLRRADLEDVVIPVVGRSQTIARWWRTPLALLFIDGGHTMEQAFADYRGWIGHLAPGAMLAIHDVFPNSEDGGRPPFEIYQYAKASGLFEDLGLFKSLARLRRLPA